MDIISIKELVLTQFEITSQQLYSRSHKKDYVDARRALAYLLRKKTDLSLQQIGARFNRHHSSILYHVNRAHDLIDVDYEFREKIKSIEEEIDFKPISLKDKGSLKLIMDAIVWDEKGTTRENIKKLLG